MQLYISRGEEISGPFSYEQVQDYLTAGVLFSEDLACWHDGTGGWMPLGELMAQTPGHTTPPPALTQPEPAITTTPANSSTKKKLLIGISAVVTVLAIAAGAGIWFWLGLDKDKSPANNPNPGAEIKANSDQEPEEVAAKLTAAEASEILGEDIGRWKMTGKHMPNPEEEDAPDAEPFESTFEVRWKVEGKSLVCIWAMVINGNKVQFVGYKDFDAKKGVFTWRTKGDGFPEMITRERYDRQTKTLLWEFTYPDGTKEASTFQIVNKDKRLQKTQATRNGKVVFRNEATFTRMAKPEPSNPIIAKLTPAEAAEVMAWEIGKWETKGQAKQLGEKEGGGLIETKFETESSMECAWKEGGRSLEYKFSMTQGGEIIMFFGRKHYDAAKGVFIYRQWGERMPESISHERYDLATQTFYAETAPVIPPVKTRSTAVTKRIGNNKTQQRLEVREGDQLVYAHDIVSTRINTPPTEVDPNLGKIESPEALAKRTLDALSKNDFPALSKLGAESLPKEVLIDTMVNLRYAVTEENIKHTAQRRNITEEEAKEYLKEKIQKEKARMEEMYEKGIKEETADRKKSFDRVIAEGKKQANIEWGKVSFVRLEGKPFEKNGIKGGDFFIVLAYQSNNFKIKLDDCMHYPKHGWFLTHGPDWGDGTDAGPPDETSEGESSHEEPAQPEPATDAPAKGLVAYYPFNGNARDEAGNDHHGQVFGAKLTADRHGKANSAYQFKLGDHIKIDGLMGKPRHLTLSAWLKLEGPQGRLGSEIISLGDIAVLRADNKSTNAQRVGSGGVFFGGEKFWIHTMAPANYSGTGWHQIVFTFDDEANAQVTYVDGKQMVSKKNPKSIVYEGGGTDTFIGVHGKTAKQNWRSQGIIDDLRVYDRALTTAEVEKLFRIEKPAFPLKAGNPIIVTTIADVRSKAEAGDAQAQLSLGLKYIRGSDGLEKDPVVTEDWWLRAAKQGNNMAKYYLGLFYSRGELGEKDALKAYIWSKLDLKGGNQRSKQLVEQLEAELTPEQIAEADAFVKAFIPAGETQEISTPDISGGTIEAVEAKLKAGADLNRIIWPKYNATLLHVAVQKGRPDVVELLLKNGAKPNPLNNNSGTPLDRLYNAKKSSPEIFIQLETILKKYGGKKAEDLNKTTSPTAPVEPSKPTKKLTPEEINEALSLRVGTFKVTEKESGKALETFTGTWVKKGLSTEFRNTGENKAGAIATYDLVKNLFIENFENGDSIHHSTWNPLTKTLVRKLISPKPPAGESVTMFLRKIDPNKNDIRVEFRRNGELVRKIEAIGTRIEKPAELAPTTQTNPEPGTKFVQYTILGTLTDNFDMRKAESNVEDALAKHPDVDAMVGLFEYNSPAILKSLKKANQLGKVKVIGFDENDATLRAIKDGTLHGTVVHNPYQLGYKSIEVLNALKQGNDRGISKDGIIDVPARAIRQNNVEQFQATLNEHLKGREIRQLHKDKPRFAFVSNGLAQFWRIASIGTDKAADEFNVNFGFHSPTKGVQHQNEILRELVAKGIDGIAVSPIDPANQNALLQEIARKTILITQDSDAPDSNRRAFIGMDNYEAGRLCGKLVKEALPKGGKVMVFVGRLDLESAKKRQQGLIDELKATDKIAPSPKPEATKPEPTKGINQTSKVKIGTPIWEFETGGTVNSSSPAIGSDGTLYVGSVDYKLYAIKTDSKGLAKSPWPMRGQNARHTGRVMKKE